MDPWGCVLPYLTLCVCVCVCEKHTHCDLCLRVELEEHTGHAHTWIWRSWRWPGPGYPRDAARPVDCRRVCEGSTSLRVRTGEVLASSRLGRFSRSRYRYCRSPALGRQDPSSPARRPSGAEVRVRVWARGPKARSLSRRTTSENKHELYLSDRSQRWTETSERRPALSRAPLLNSTVRSVPSCS